MARIAALGSLQLLVSAAAIAALVRGDEDATTIALLHLGLVAAAVLLGVFALGLLAQVSRQRGALFTLAFGAIPFALFASLFVVYLIDFVALSSWGHLVSFALMRQFLANLPNLIVLMPWNAAVVFACLAASAWVCGRSAAGLRRAFEQRFSRFAPLSLCSVAILAAWLAGVSGGQLARSWQLWRREPLITLLDLELPRPEQPALAAESAERSRYASPAPSRRAHVILVVVDALRAASMGVYGYARPTTPYLSALYGRGELARIDLALSSCSQSECGVLSVLGSQSAGRLNPNGLALHDVLHLLGYRTVFLLSGSHLEWPGLRSMFGAHVDVVHDDPTNDDANLLRALRSLPDADRPTFLYLHLMSAHGFGVQRREHQIYQPTEKRFNLLYDVKRALGVGSVADLRQRVINRYDNGVLQADATIARLFGLLEQKGLLRDAIVAIVADHGEAFGERGEAYYGHGRDLYQELIRIPLLFRDTSARPDLRTDFATQADVAPTLLDLLGAAIPDSWDGSSLRAGAPRRLSFHEDSIPGPRARSGHDERVRAVVEREESGALYKLLRFEERVGSDERNVRHELYELRSDPDERRNLIDTIEPARRAALEARLREHFRD